jgi:cell envelope opacity-associated protein A
MFKMEKVMSSNANDVNLTEVSSIEEVMLPSLSVGGRESKGGVEEDYVLVKSRGEEFEDLDEDDSEEDNDFDDIDDDDDDDDDEEDEEWMERLRIFEDARNLRKVASFFLHPEKPVECDPIYSARCFFSRSSAVTEDEECANILEDAALLKKLAKDYLHPELSAETTNSLALGRNYFLRPSAVQQETTEYADERARIIEDAMMLKKNAVYYYHPEAPTSNDGISTAMGRNFFTRPSAMEQETKEEADECARIMADAQLMKKNAVVYYHPEAPINTFGIDTAMGRNFFTRPSAMEQETKEDADERARILSDARLLKKQATVYYHPEAPIENTGVSTSMGRNYFSRASAMEQESKEEADERARIMADAQLMKKNATIYYHPEAPINTSGTGTAMGRNYFTRPSAMEQETKEEADERACVMADAKLLVKNATMYYHPEAPINADGINTAMGRNYFSRASAMDQETKEEADERARVLSDAHLLMKNATMYYHPEAPINTSGVGTAMGRNYFTRPSAVIAEVGKVELGRKIRDTPKKVVVPSSKSITNKHVFAGKLGPENDISEMPRSASAVMLFSPNDDMGEAF